jgi:hypothetical protein
MNLSSIFKSVELIFVTVPLTFKSPVRVREANVGESAVCKPESTSVLTPFVASLIVPCEGELNTDADTMDHPSTVA